MKFITLVIAILFFMLNAIANESEERILIREVGYIYQGNTYEDFSKLKAILDLAPRNYFISYHFLPCSEKIDLLTKKLEKYIKIRKFSKISGSFPACGCYCDYDDVE